MNWMSLFPVLAQAPADPSRPLNREESPRKLPSVTIVDIGCGFGGLLVALSSVFPDDLILGKRCLRASMRFCPVVIDQLHQEWRLEHR